MFLGRVERTGLTYVNRVVPVLWHSSSLLRVASLRLPSSYDHLFVLAMEDWAMAFPLVP